jgi:hypothetical protein
MAGGTRQPKAYQVVRPSKQVTRLRAGDGAVAPAATSFGVKPPKLV